MKAVLIRNKRLIMGEVPDPVPADGEVLIKVQAAALNRADLLQREGNYPPPPGAPEWPGLEVAGEIIESKSKMWKKGDMVCALLGGGGYAELVKASAGACMPIPKGLTPVEASSLPEAYATAYLNLFVEGASKPGETLLMHAGASGLASVIIPLAKAFGMRVITTVLTDEAKAGIAHLGADRVVVAPKESIVEALKEEAEAGHPVNVAIDCLGDEMLGECLPHVAFGCRWIIIATLAGDFSRVNFRTVYMKNIRLIGSTLRSKPQERKEQILAELVEKIWPKLESRELKPTVYKVLPIERAEEAQDILYRGENVGKVVLTVGK